MKITIPALFVGILLAACAGAPIGTVEPSPLYTLESGLDTACNAPTQWQIQFNRSGGFAGVNESMTLDSGGNLTVQSERPEVNARKTISSDRVSAVSGLLARACPFAMEPNDTGCADCFLYKLDVQMDGQTYVILATDVTLTEELHPLINELSNLIQDTK